MLKQLVLLTALLIKYHVGGTYELYYKEYQTAQTKNFLDKIYEGSAKGLVSNLIMGDLLADEEYEELKRLLEKGKGQQ